MNGYTYPEQPVKPATKEQLRKLCDLLLEWGYKEGAIALDNAIDVIQAEADWKKFTDEVLASEKDYTDLLATQAYAANQMSVIESDPPMDDHWYHDNPNY